MGFYNPPSKSVALDVYNKSSKIMQLCWNCWNAKGTHVYAKQAPICKMWGILAVCHNCRRSVKGNVVFYT